ncbi:MAG: glycosyltransferase family 2 protein [Chloroflexi bacterium]|nr:glycosyltransferase family 2 protein [Chloroflexota bacterium]
MSLWASVIIPNWNGAALLPTCLDSLRRQTFSDFKTVVVDNGSQDSSTILIQEQYPEVRLISLPRNYGFSRAVNEGIRQTDSPMVVLLNNDTEAEPGWLETLHAAAEEYPTASFFASKILLFNRRQILHSAGDYYRIDGIPGNRGVWEVDDGQYDSSRDVFSACAAAAAYRRTLLDEIGLLDEELVAYCEDVDLAFRAQLAGHHGLFVPQARVYHRLSTTGGGPLASYFCGRNFLLLLAKDMPAPLLRRHWQKIMAAQISFTWQALRHLQEAAARARLKGQIAGLLALPRMIRIRRAIQQRKRVSDAYIESVLTPTSVEKLRFPVP